MSPKLFEVFIDRVASFIASRQLAEQDFDTFNFLLCQFSVLLFADDAVVLARNETQLQKVVNAFAAFC